ncbi:MAG: sporulation protein YtfJ [Ruminococcaceae bacterium]|nr:sporulation protein YtfJ [Oscillospiraceae bacterium]
MANGEQHPISGLMSVTLEKIRQMVDSNTIIGNPINTADGSTILPVSKVSFGFTSGGSDFVSSKSPKDLFGGGSGAGVSITPVGFLVLHNGNVRFIQVAEKDNSIDRVLNMLPEIVDKLQGFMDKKKADKAAKAATPEADDAMPTEEAPGPASFTVDETVVTDKDL